MADVMPGPEYDPEHTPMREAAVRCGLRVKRSGHINAVLVDDTTGEVVFDGLCWPDAWDFMRRERGLVAQAALEAKHGTV